MIFFIFMMLIAATIILVPLCMLIVEMFDIPELFQRIQNFFIKHHK